MLGSLAGSKPTGLLSTLQSAWIEEQNKKFNALIQEGAAEILCLTQAADQHYFPSHIFKYYDNLTTTVEASFKNGIPALTITQADDDLSFRGPDCSTNPLAAFSILTQDEIDEHNNRIGAQKAKKPLLEALEELDANLKDLYENSPMKASLGTNYTDRVTALQDSLKAEISKLNNATTGAAVLESRDAFRTTQKEIDDFIKFYGPNSTLGVNYKVQLENALDVIVAELEKVQSTEIPLSKIEEIISKLEGNNVIPGVMTPVVKDALSKTASDSDLTIASIRKSLGEQGLLLSKKTRAEVSIFSKAQAQLRDNFAAVTNPVALSAFRVAPSALSIPPAAAKAISCMLTLDSIADQKNAEGLSQAIGNYKMHERRDFATIQNFNQNVSIDQLKEIVDVEAKPKEAKPILSRSMLVMMRNQYPFVLRVTLMTCC